jgi:hypothetical protein
VAIGVRFATPDRAVGCCHCWLCSSGGMELKFFLSQVPGKVVERMMGGMIQVSLRLVERGGNDIEKHARVPSKGVHWTLGLEVRGSLHVRRVDPLQLRRIGWRGYREPAGGQQTASVRLELQSNLSTHTPPRHLVCNLHCGILANCNPRQNVVFSH